MPANTLKEKLINKIKQTDDSGLLEEASALFELHEPETIYTINEEQEKAIKKAKEQIKNGLTISNDDANSEAEKWIKE